MSNRIPPGVYALLALFAFLSHTCKLVVVAHPEASRATEIELNEGIEGLIDGCLIADYESIRTFYGDIYAENAVQAGRLHRPDNTTARGGGTYNRFDKLWRNQVDSEGNFIVPYEFNAESKFPSSQRNFIDKALEELSDALGGYIKFPKKTSSHDAFITITSKGGCWSYIGMTDRASKDKGQQLNLEPNDSRGRGCVDRGTVQHEMMHALGFYHEQSRPDRDKYVTINFQNIEDGGESEFEKSTKIDTRGAKYDYDSVMHYGPYSFSKNDKPTIDAHGNEIGQRDSASDLDLIQLRLLYQCKDKINTFEEYQRAPCSPECTCSLGFSGCNGNDDSCRGDLKCVNNKCIKAGTPTKPTPVPSPQPTSPPPQPTPVPSPPTTPSPGGPSCCQTLVAESNFQYNGDREVCVNVKVTGACSRRVPYADAKAACEASNARLCSLQELQAREANGLGCKLKKRHVWTSTTCGSIGGLYIARGYKGTKERCWSPRLNPGLKARIICCANQCRS